jgi:hypothetical protein
VCRGNQSTQNRGIQNHTDEGLILDDKVVFKSLTMVFK